MTNIFLSTERVVRNLLFIASRRRYFLVFFLYCHTVSFAASFDCGKAKAGVETLICSNVELGRLDDQLNAAYETPESSQRTRKELADSQRKWLRDVRNRCVDAACLSNAYRTRIAWLRARAEENNPTCHVNMQTIVGRWARVKNGDFEEFALTINAGERNFSSWLHHRPEHMGSWNLQGCMLHIENSQNRALDFDYSILDVRNGLLYLKSMDDEGESRYRSVIQK